MTRKLSLFMLAIVLMPSLRSLEAAPAPLPVRDVRITAYDKNGNLIPNFDIRVSFRRSDQEPWGYSTDVRTGQDGTVIVIPPYDRDACQMRVEESFDERFFSLSRGTGRTEVRYDSDSDFTAADDLTAVEAEMMSGTLLFAAPGDL